MDEKIKQINPERYYRPREIATLELITNSKNKRDYFFVLRLIHKGRIRAKDRGLGETPYYIVRGSEIIRYLNEIK